MENALHIAAIWAHVLGIAIFVGPQVFLAFAWVPTSRGLTDPKVRAKAMRTMTDRFGYMSVAGLVLIVAAGSYLIATWRDYHGFPDDISFTDIRYGVLFIIKMSILMVMLAVIGLHTFVVGRKRLEYQEAIARGERVDEAAVARITRLSMALSITGLVLTLVIMVFGAAMSSTNFSFQDF